MNTFTFLPTYPLVCLLDHLQAKNDYPISDSGCREILNSKGGYLDETQVIAVAKIFLAIVDEIPPFENRPSNTTTLKYHKISELISKTNKMSVEECFSIVNKDFSLLQKRLLLKTMLEIIGKSNKGKDEKMKVFATVCKVAGLTLDAAYELAETKSEYFIYNFKRTNY